MITNAQRALCSLLSIAGAVTLVLAAAPATAQSSEVEQMRTAHVSYADLDLGRPAGRATFERRLAGAASQVCAASVWQRYAVDPTCRERALNRARRAAGIVRD
ncbi:UrcA family protein [Sphingomonas sp. RHCKR7]|uniref:UrcA family protein n=1 Tax=Sphingomonas folli TaxID=2862497 RepID=UPI001C6749DD|nr:UrcA family protein [Sphingomonas folli]MBW6527891.1 UrcA family protein [Sphingomonas folli]